MASAKDLLKLIPGVITIPELKDLLEERGPNSTFTISFAGEKAVGMNEEMKPVLHFLEIKKSLVVSKGRGNALSQLFGSDDLVGKKIRLGVEVINGKEQAVVLAATD